MISVKVDLSQTNDFFRHIEDRQVPFAMSLALNRVAVVGQQAEQDRLKSTFKLRRETWNLQGIYISKTDRATKSSWVVVIQVQDSRSHLNKFETEGEHVPHHGKSLFIPNPEVFKSKVIGRDNLLAPKNLHLHSDGKGRIIGDQSSFLVRSPKGAFVLQHQQAVHKGFTKASLKGMSLDRPDKALKAKKGTRDAGARLLYTLKSRVSVPLKLAFTSTIADKITTAWPDVAAQAIDEAIRGAR